MTKTEFIAALHAKNPHLTKAQVVSFLDTLNSTVITNLKALGEASVPGLVKFKAVKKAATQERQGINPFTKQAITIPAKPASTKVKASVAKALKESVV